MSRRNSIEDDIYDDLIEYVTSRSRNDIVFDNLQYMMEGDRGNYDTTMMKNMVHNTLNIYEFFVDEYYRNKSEDQCYEKAIEFIAETTAAKEVFRSRSVLNKLSDKEQRELDNLISDSRDVLGEYNTYFNQSKRRNTVSTRDRSSGRDRFRNDDRSTRYGSGRYQRNDDDRRNYFDESESTARQPESGSSYRARAVARRTEANRNQNEVPVARGSRQQRDERPTRHDRREQYVTNPGEFIFYGRDRKNVVVPNYNPATQRLQAVVNADNELSFQVLEIENMDAETHKNVIDSLLTKHRNDEYVNAIEKKAVYKIDNYELDAAMVENERVVEILSEWVDQGKIKEGTTFNDLEDSQKRAILNESAKRLNAARDAKEASRKAKLINEGTYEQASRQMEMVAVDIDPVATSVQSVVNRFIATYGGELAADHDRLKAYRFNYNKITALHRCEGAAEHENLLNILVGFHGPSTTVQKITQSLCDKKIPIGLFNRLNNLCTVSANEWLRYVMDIPQLQLTNFIDDINDLSEWLVKQVENGELKNEDVNGLNQYVSRRAGIIVNKDILENERYQSVLSNGESTKPDLGTIQTIYGQESGSITYLPLTAAEMGLNPGGSLGYNMLQLKYNTLYSSLFNTSQTYGPHDYVVTLDGEYFRVVGRVDDGIVLKTMQGF